MSHQRISESGIHTESRSNIKVIQLVNRSMPDFPYLESCGITRLQYCLRCPGEYLLQLEHLNNSSSVILSHWIRRIQSCTFLYQHFPYPALRAFKVFTLQHLLPYLIGSVVKTIQVTKKVPKKLTYPPQLSRFKGNITFS